jgi:hypothetical protein
VLDVVGETASPEVARTLTATAKAGSIAVTPDGTHVVVTASHGAVRLSLDDLQADRRFQGRTSNAVAVNDDGRVAVASDVNVSVFLPHLAQPYARVRQTTVTGGLAWNGDGVLMFYKQPGEMTLVIEHPRGQTEIRFKQPVHTYPYGGRSDITVVTNLPRGMPLSVVVRQRGGQAHRLYGITTDRNGTASIDVRVTMSSDVGVIFDGTSLFSRRSGRTSFLVMARITTRMTRAYAREGRYALYHAGRRDAVQAVHVQANNEGSCVSGTAQIRMNGHWRKYGSAGCAHLNAVSRAFLSLSSDQRVGSSFRLSAHFDGSESNNAATSRWVYLRFTA